jgi:XTP/dITP diphosphohydrolase
VISSPEADILRELDRTVYFATGNRNKYHEAAGVAAAFGVILKHMKMKKKEIQSDSLAEIASFAAKEAAKSESKSVVVEDAGFFVQGLDDFPGPYSAFVFDALGYEGILRLMRGVRNRRAFFQATVAYCEPNGLPTCFTGIIRGTVAKAPKGSRGFGFDPIFVPTGQRRTFAQMVIAEKNLRSHRARAFTKFCKWFVSNRQPPRQVK